MSGTIKPPAEPALAAAQKRIEALEGLLREASAAAFFGYPSDPANLRQRIDDALALASPSESAPQPTPETRVDLGALEKLRAAVPRELAVRMGVCKHDHPDTSADVVGTKGEFFADCGCDGVASVRAKLIVAAVNALPSLIAELRARRAAPTGQQREAGAQDGLRRGETYLEYVARAAAPPSAPQEGLFKEGALAMREDHIVALDRLRRELDRLAEEAATECAETDWNRGRAYAYRFAAQNLNALVGQLVNARALPLPESALLTKAAPLTQPAVPADAQCESVRGKRCHRYAGHPDKHCHCGAPFPTDNERHPAAPAPVETRLTEEGK